MAGNENDAKDAGMYSDIETNLATPDEKTGLIEELEKTEEEIATLRQVLTAKEQRATELRKLLGINLRTQSINQLKEGMHKLQTSDAYQKTSAGIKSAGTATANVFSSVSSSVSSKFAEMKNSPAFKSFEERVEGVGTSIMAKVSGTGKDDLNKGDSPASSPVVEEQPISAPI